VAVHNLVPAAALESAAVVRNESHGAGIEAAHGDLVVVAAARESYLEHILFADDVVTSLGKSPVLVVASRRMIVAAEKGLGKAAVLVATSREMIVVAEMRLGNPALLAETNPGMIVAAETGFGKPDLLAAMNPGDTLAADDDAAKELPGQ